MTEERLTGTRFILALYLDINRYIPGRSDLAQELGCRGQSALFPLKDALHTFRRAADKCDLAGRFGEKNECRGKLIAQQVCLYRFTRQLTVRERTRGAL